MKLEHIQQLTKGKKSWIKIWSRAMPHRLKPYEREIYERALKNKYLEINQKQRINLINIWDKTCQAQWWENIIFIKDINQASVEKNNNIIFSWEISEAKKILEKNLQK